MITPDPSLKKHAPATERNQAPILEVLKDCLPDHGTILEIASGTGQHAAYFVEHLPNIFWQPSDPDEDNRKSISAWWWQKQFKNILTPLDISADDAVWPVEVNAPPQPVSAIVCINMVHIAPWSATVGLFQGAQRLLPKGGILYLYGPYLQQDVPTAASNLAFDENLRARNPAWGIRALEDVIDCARAHGFEHVRTVAMPANNLSVVFAKT